MEICKGTSISDVSDVFSEKSSVSGEFGSQDWVEEGEEEEEVEEEEEEGDGEEEGKGRKKVEVELLDRKPRRGTGSKGHRWASSTTREREISELKQSTPGEGEGDGGEERAGSSSEGSSTASLCSTDLLSPEAQRIAQEIIQESEKTPPHSAVSHTLSHTPPTFTTEVKRQSLEVVLRREGWRREREMERQSYLRVEERSAWDSSEDEEDGEPSHTGTGRQQFRGHSPQKTDILFNPHGPRRPLSAQPPSSLSSRKPSSRPQSAEEMSRAQCRLREYVLPVPQQPVGRMVRAHSGQQAHMQSGPPKDKLQSQSERGRPPHTPSLAQPGSTTDKGAIIIDLSQLQLSVDSADSSDVDDSK